MTGLARLLRRLRALIRYGAAERDLDDELRYHLERDIDRFVRDGMDPRDARAAALRDFDGFERTKDAIRDARGVRLANELRQDVRYACRILRRDPSLTIVVTLTLALAVGGNAAIFSVFNGVLLRPLELPEPHRLAVIGEQTPTRPDMGVAYPDFLDWCARQSTFDDLAASLVIGGVMTGGGEPERVFGRAVTRSFFGTLGVAFTAGRGFTGDEDRPGGARAIVLGYALWQRRYGGDPAILGRTVVYNGDPYTVVGILTARFEFYGQANANNDFFLPLGHLAANGYMRERDSHPVRVIGRMKPGVSIARARADLATIAAALAVAYPASNRAVGVRVQSLLDDYVGDVRLALSVVLAAALFVLAIACANIANLLLARATARRREIALRLALGAGRTRVARQLITESLLLSAAGGAAGLVLGRAAASAIGTLLPESMPRATDIVLDWRVALFTLSITVLAGLASGAAPALQTAGVDIRRFLNEGGRGSTPGARRTREALVVLQVALCLALLHGAGLLMRSFGALIRVDPGFDSRHVVTMRVRLPDGRYRDRARVLMALDQVLTRVSAIPGIESACLTTGVPLGRASEERFRIDGQPEPPRDRLPVALAQWTSADCHRTLGIGLLAGRHFTKSDREGAPDVAIVDEEFVRRSFPGRPLDAALDHRVQLAGEDSRWRTIVGVVRHIRHAALDEQPAAQIYAPYLQMDPGWQLEIGRAMDVAVRSLDDGAAVVAAIRKEVTAIDPEVPLSHVRTLDSAMAQAVAPRVFNIVLMGVFAGVALVLCVVGLHGVMSYSVTQRKREIGVRVALGAEPREVVRLLAGRAARMLLAGVAIGVTIALGGARLLQGLLYSVRPADPLTLAGAAVLLAVVAGSAAYLPARRATRLDPIAALRSE